MRTNIENDKKYISQGERIIQSISEIPLKEINRLERRNSKWSKHLDLG